MAELVMIPFAAFLAQSLSTRWLFALSAGLFTISSALCGMAWDIDSMILFRVLQGFTGGAMVPTVFATGFAMFSGPQRAMIPAILGMVSVLAPTLGPTVGGWLTEAVGWRSIFYINIIPGALVTILAITVIKVDRPSLSMLKTIDYSHLVAMAVFLGGLEYVLEEGPRSSGSRTRHRHRRLGDARGLRPVHRALVPVRRTDRQAVPFRKPTFVFACVFNLVIGFGLYSSTYLIPVFLGRVRGYDSLEIGTTVFVTGIAQILSTVIAARLSHAGRRSGSSSRRPVPVRRGPVADLAHDQRVGLHGAAGPQALRGFAIMLCIVPSVTWPWAASRWPSCATPRACST
jgi:DHA2 family multidrug resistance protein